MKENTLQGFKADMSNSKHGTYIDFKKLKRRWEISKLLSFQNTFLNCLNVQI